MEEVYQVTSSELFKAETVSRGYSEPPKWLLSDLLGYYPFILGYSAPLSSEKKRFVPIPNDLHTIPGLQETNPDEDFSVELSPPEYHKLNSRFRMEQYLQEILDANTATMELDKKMFANPAAEKNFKKMFAKAVTVEDIKDMEPIKNMFDSARIIWRIKGNGGIMGRICGHATLMEHYRFIGMAAKTAAMDLDMKMLANPAEEENFKKMLARAATAMGERPAINPIYSLAEFGSSLLMDPNYCLKLDSGASMHAVGDYMLLKNFRSFYGMPYRPVTLPDGSQLQIVGIGNIETERFRIPDVYLVEGLRTNLISVSQLDERHGLCCAFFKNKCEISNINRKIVGEAILQENGLYVLNFLEVK